MKNLFNVIQQYASRFRSVSGITSDGPRMQSAYELDTDGTNGSDVVAEQYGRDSFLRKRRDISPPFPPRMATPPIEDNSENMFGWHKDDERHATISKIDWTNQADPDMDSNDSDDEDDYVSLFPDEIRWKGITLEHGIPYNRD